MTLHKDATVQLTHDFYPQHGPMIKRGTSGRVLSKVTFHHACMVEFTINRLTVIARVSDDDLAEVRPNARV